MFRDSLLLLMGEQVSFKYMMKTIIIYYSYSGHTKMIAEMIQKRLDCDIQRIVPIIPYSNDYQSVVSLTEDNIQSKLTPDIKPLDVDLNLYDKIIIGTPVWWYTMAPPIRTFLTKNNLMGKTVELFATNAGWLGETFNEMGELCNGEIKSQKSITFDSNYQANKLTIPDEELKSWFNNI